MAKTVYTLNFPRLSGGLNLRELDDAGMKTSQSPEMKNLWWSDGLLRSREGQVLLIGGTARGCAAYERDFRDYGFFHIGNALVCADLRLEEPRYHTLYEGLAEEGGSFFRYGDHLYYKTAGAFVKVTYTGEGTPPFSAADLVPYVPTILMNADPESGAGDPYQSENRLGDTVRVLYTPKEGVTVYRLPMAEITAVESVTAEGEAVGDCTVDLTEGTVTFAQAPAGEANSVAITFRKPNAQAYDALMTCRYAAVYGAGTEVCMVLGGSKTAPNAVFWNGNGSAGMEDGYFPIPFYNLCGDVGEAVTGFGRQYSDLIVLKEGSVGKLEAGIETVDERSLLSLTYGQINSRLGCDLPGTIRLIENNLVFCNSRHGVQILLSASAAYENNLFTVSRNVNNGLLPLLSGAENVVAFDDDSRYWLCADGKVYLWDYTISSHTDPGWFYFTDIFAASFLRCANKSFHMGRDGSLVAFRSVLSDFNGPIEKLYAFPTQRLGGYGRLKDVLAVSLALRHDTDSDITVDYETDWGGWRDPITVRSYSYRLSPRNLAYRCLGVQRFAHVERRRPPARRVRHFSLRLSNNLAGQDLAVVSAAIEYRYTGKER